MWFIRKQVFYVLMYLLNLDCCLFISGEVPIYYTAVVVNEE